MNMILVWPRTMKPLVFLNPKTSILTQKLAHKFNLLLSVRIYHSCVEIKPCMFCISVNVCLSWSEFCYGNTITIFCPCVFAVIHIFLNMRLRKKSFHYVCPCCGCIFCLLFVLMIVVAIILRCCCLLHVMLVYATPDFTWSVSHVYYF